MLHNFVNVFLWDKIKIGPFQAYDTIHRFEYLQKQNNNIINRISKVEDLLSGGVVDIMGGETLNNKKTTTKQGRQYNEEFLMIF